MLNRPICFECNTRIHLPFLSLRLHCGQCWGKTKDDALSSTNLKNGIHDSPDKVIVLIVGNVTGGEKSASVRPRLAGVAYVEFDALPGFFARNGMPALILSPLSARKFDAVDLARALQDTGFPGVYYAVAPPVPAPMVVKQEVRRAAPDILFDLLTPDDLELLKRTGLP